MACVYANMDLIKDVVRSSTCTLSFIPLFFTTSLAACFYFFFCFVLCVEFVDASNKSFGKFLLLVSISFLVLNTKWFNVYQYNQINITMNEVIFGTAHARMPTQYR